MNAVNSMSVLNKVQAQNATSSGDGSIVSHKNFDMAHPQKIDEQTLNTLLGMFDLQNPDQSTNGVMKGSTKDGGRIGEGHGASIRSE